MEQPKFTNISGSSRSGKLQSNRFPDLLPMKETPSLTTINACGFKIYGKSDYDEKTDSYMTTQYFVLLFIPIFPVARYRVIPLGRNKRKFLGVKFETGNERYQFLGKGKFRKFEKCWWGVFIAVFIFLLSQVIAINLTGRNIFNP